MPAFALAVRRGCGTRKKGGIYAECGMAQHGESGHPLEHFLQDPPIPIEPSSIGLSAVGVRLIERDGVWHVFDWVGEQHYPNVTDFLEEARQFGVSRGPFPKHLDFSKLTSASKLVLVHRRAWIGQTAAYHDDWRQIPGLSWTYCPFENDAVKPDHATPAGNMCAGYWWQDIEPMDDAEQVMPDGENPRDIVRKVASTVYSAALRPDGHVPEYSPAIFASFPIHRLAVVNDQEGGKHEAGLDAASASALPVDLVED